VENVKRQANNVVQRF